MIRKQLLHFKEYFEKKNEKWRVEFGEELEENINRETVYFVINEDSKINKQKIIDFSIFYIVSRKKDGLLDFREEVKKFIKEDLEKEFETRDCFNTSGYRVSYSIDQLRDTLRIAEIQCSYDYTTMREGEEETYQNMEVLKDEVDMKE